MISTERYRPFFALIDVHFVLSSTLVSCPWRSGLRGVPYDLGRRPYGFFNNFLSTLTIAVGKFPLGKWFIPVCPAELFRLFVPVYQVEKNKWKATNDFYWKNIALFTSTTKLIMKRMWFKMHRIWSKAYQKKCYEITFLSRQFTVFVFKFNIIYNYIIK